MEEILRETGEQGLRALLELVPVVIVLLVIMTTVIFIPVKKEKEHKEKVDVRLVALFASIFWNAVALVAYKDSFFSIEGGVKLAIGTVVSIFLIHIRHLIILKRK